jgi:hypothetical protein
MKTTSGGERHLMGTATERTAVAGVLFLTLSAVLLPRLAAAEVPNSTECLVLDIDRIGSSRLTEMIDRPGLDLWLELDDELFVCAAESTLTELEKLATVERRLGTLEVGSLRLAFRQSRVQLEEAGSKVLASGGLFSVVEVPRGAASFEPGSGELLPLRSGLVLARQIENEASHERAVSPLVEGTVGRLVSSVETDRWFADVESLAAWNRYSLGSGIGEARRWLVQRFREIPGLKVRSHFFRAAGTEVANVVATLPGRSRPDDWFIVGAHYDSTSDTPEVAAPGAEDNASGCAGVLEMARIFAANRPEASVLFICFAAEEQGLFGAIEHAARLLERGNAAKTGAMLNLDMIAFTEDEDLDCLLQSSEEWRFLVDDLVDAAERYTELRIVTSFVLGGSDHVPYARSGIAAVLSIENDWDVYPHYHRTSDTPDKLTPAMAAEILRMNVGALARLAGVADVTGCLEVDEQPLVGGRVVSSQRGDARQVIRTDRQGCFAVDPLVRGRRFRLKIKVAGFGDGSRLRSCVRLLGEPLVGRKVALRQPGVAARIDRTDENGCFEFDARADAPFTLVLRGPDVPEG